MANKRKHKRYIKRCKTEFASSDRSYRGISSDFSVDGLFIRTLHPLEPDTVIDMTVHLPDGSESSLRGRVARASSTPRGRVVGAPSGKAARDGMGVKIIEKDANYLRFLGSLVGERRPIAEAARTPEKSSSEKPATTRELLLELISTQTALINLLEKQGTIDRKKLREEIKRIIKR